VCVVWIWFMFVILERWTFWCLAILTCSVLSQSDGVTGSCRKSIFRSPLPLPSQLNQSDGVTGSCRKSIFRSTLPPPLTTQPIRWSHWLMCESCGKSIFIFYPPPFPSQLNQSDGVTGSCRKSIFRSTLFPPSQLNKSDGVTGSCRKSINRSSSSQPLNRSCRLLWGFHYFLLSVQIDIPWLLGCGCIQSYPAFPVQLCSVFNMSIIA